MERDSGRHKQFVDDERGQATVEYALVLGALMCVLVALGSLGDAVSDGVLVEHALASAAHHVQASAGWVADVFGC